MKLRIAPLLLAAVAILGVAQAESRYSIVRAAERSVWDGVYTEEQAKRGALLYTASCAACHGPDLTGGEMASALVGGDFTSNWNGLTLGDLFERMRVSMPQNAPGSLSRQTNADILAYVLGVNRFPAGSTELARETEVLQQIRFQSFKPQ